MQGDHVFFVDSFVYFGIAIGSGGRSFLEINRCLEIAFSAMYSLNQSVWRCRNLHRRTKLKQFRGLVLPYMLDGSETWRTGTRERGHLNYFSTRVLRRVIGYCWDNFVSNDRDWDAPGDMHDTKTPTATIWSQGELLGVQSNLQSDL